MDFAALSKMAKDATTKAKATATKLAEQAKERLEDTEGNKQMMQQFMLPEQPLIIVTTKCGKERLRLCMTSE